MDSVLIVVLAAASACVVTTVLAALLLMAQRWLVRYGLCTIDVNDGARELTVTGGDSLLASLKGEGLFLPSACGGRGTCSYCKVKMLTGGGPVAPTEEPLLTPEEIASGVRIGCLVKVRQDCSIEVPKELFSIRAYQGVVDQITDLTHDIKLLRIRLTDPPAIDFTAGQYVQLEAPAYGSSPETVSRAYSLASEPAERECIELIIRLVPGGLCTTWVFTALTEGQTVRFTGPYGDFGLTDSNAEMVWIAGGSGMAPFWSILQHMKRNNIARTCTYFFGAQDTRDMFLVEELRRLEEELGWFTFVPALSAPSAADDWAGETGLITEVLDRRLDGDASRVEAYLCGSGGMIAAAGDVLGAKGIAADRTFYDEFT